MKYEHKIIDFSDFWRAASGPDSYGNEGWRVAGVIRDFSSGATTTRVVLEREVR